MIWVFQVYEIGTSFYNVPGVYIFAKQEHDHLNQLAWKALYIGQTTSQQERLSDHPIESAARILGATHIHAVGNVHEEEQRLQIERTLIDAYDPPLNRNS